MSSQPSHQYEPLCQFLDSQPASHSFSLLDLPSCLYLILGARTRVADEASLVPLGKKARSLIVCQFHKMEFDEQRQKGLFTKLNKVSQFYNWILLQCCLNVKQYKSAIIVNLGSNVSSVRSISNSVRTVNSALCAFCKVR